MLKLERLREKLVENEVDGLLVTNRYNRQYMTGFTGSTGAALITADKALFLTDFRYIEQATKECIGFEIVDVATTGGKYAFLVNEKAGEFGIKRLAFEEREMTFADYKEYEEALVGKIEMVSTSGLVEGLRLIKTADEIATLQIAAEIADSAFHHILGFIKPGLTEVEVANELEFFMRKAGASCSSFGMIVASGARSALPHGVASNKVIEKGEMLTLDFGAYYNYYASDMTRTIAVGDPGEKMKEIYAIVKEAQAYANAQICPGMTCKEADALARDIIDAKGYKEFFGHGLGHGIGLEVHELPNVSFKSDDVLVAGMTITNEPGIYIPDLGGVRIEDDLVLTEDGNYSLTISTKELIIL